MGDTQRYSEILHYLFRTMLNIEFVFGPRTSFEFCTQTIYVYETWAVGDVCRWCRNVSC